MVIKGIFGLRSQLWRPFAPTGTIGRCPAFQRGIVLKCQLKVSDASVGRLGRFSVRQRSQMRSCHRRRMHRFDWPRCQVPERFYARDGLSVLIQAIAIPGTPRQGGDNEQRGPGRVPAKLHARAHFLSERQLVTRYAVQVLAPRKEFC